MKEKTGQAELLDDSRKRVDGREVSGPSEEDNFNELMNLRREKLAQLQEKNIEPYGGRYEKTHSAVEIVHNFEAYEGQIVCIAGRLMSRRDHGKTTFADLRDETGRIQIYIRLSESSSDAYALFGKLDIGDIIGVKGKVFKTRVGEVTIAVEEFVLLSKSLRILPEKWHGLKDVDLRYRQRYLDLIVNPEVKNTFVVRSHIIQAIRRFLENKGFLEVETPMMQPLAGGATARPFITHHNALDMDLYLRIAPELYLKRLLVGGFEKVFEINRNFRNEGISTKHNPEFTMLELYQAYADYKDMMNLTEEIFLFVAQEVLGKILIPFEDQEINFSAPWQRISMLEAVKQYTGVDFEALGSNHDVEKAAIDLGIEVEPASTWGIILNRIFEDFVEPKLIQPTFVFDYPIDISPLAKKKRTDSRLCYRFELFICGREIANAFSELNDPIDQRIRFREQIDKKLSGDNLISVMDEDYLIALEYGMPPAGGLGIGIDRMVMVMTGLSSIRDVILFPLMKPREL